MGSGLNLNGDVYPISAWSTDTTPTMTTTATPTYSRYTGQIDYLQCYTTGMTTPTQTQYGATELEKYLYTPLSKYTVDSTSTTDRFIFDDYIKVIWNNTNDWSMSQIVPILKSSDFAYYRGASKRLRLKSNLIVTKNSRADYNGYVESNEQIALDTLREVVTEYEFRKYLKYGFVLVKGKSGDTYQIFRNKSHTKVWRDGKVIEEICVRIADTTVPKTDNIIAFKTIIETDENSFKKMGNVYKFKVA